MRTFLLLATLLIIILSCTSNQQTEKVEGSWLQGDKKTVIETIERQFDGFSRTMVEVHYRYEELYWAGQDENWEYADYQLEHIFEAIEKGYERRPERKLNSLEFLGAPHEMVQKAIDARSLDQFNMAFRMYNAACKSCHIKENVAFIQTIIPENRTGQTRFNPAR